MMPFISRTYSTTTPESVEQGDYAEHGYADFSGNTFPIDHNNLPTTDDIELMGHGCTPDESDIADGLTAVDLAVNLLQQHGANEPSSSSFHVGVWYTAEPEPDYATGEDITYSYHLKGFTPDQERIIYHLMCTKA